MGTVVGSKQWSLTHIQTHTHSHVNTHTHTHTHSHVNSHTHADVVDPANDQRETRSGGEG